MEPNRASAIAKWLGLVCLLVAFVLAAIIVAKLLAGREFSPALYALSGITLIFGVMMTVRSRSQSKAAG